MSASAAKTAVAAAAGAYVAWKVVDGKYRISKDFDVLRGALPALRKSQRIVKKPGANIVMSWYETLATAGGDRPVYIQAETGRTLTFADVEDLSNRIGQWTVALGLEPGEVLALLMENRPEYVPVWLGVCKAGCATALINTNLKGKPLVHAVSVAASVGLIFGSEHSAPVEASLADMRTAGVKTLACYGGDAGKPSFCDLSLDETLPSQPAGMVSEARRKGLKVTEPCVYIYTSGTTGLPKACRLSHAKILTIGSMAATAKIKMGDKMYGSGLPLYHTAANLGATHALNQGSTYVIRTRFSASKQWEDCVKYGCEGMQYIGELCRYLLTQAPTPAEQQHKLRIAMGNGLRPEIWDQFQRRFSVPEILEFYGATEGAGVLLNYCKNYEGQGAVGWSGPITNKIFPAVVVKFDIEKEFPLRDAKTGFCIQCPPGEAGELLQPIEDKLKTAEGGASNYEGYTNAEATEKKILRDVFKKGDIWYRTGDLLRKDAQGYFYFVDRIGDTFRWKGENVSTMEVSEVLSGFEGVVDANVYGVEVPGKDGRACMVAITVESGKTVDPDTFATYCRANLPPYSVPLFVRFLAEEINLTGTFKHQKVDYRNQGCDPSKITDKVWWFNIEKGTYEPYGSEIYAKISAGHSKL